MSEAATAADKPFVPESAMYRGYVLFILVVVYTFNFLDRQIIGILAVPIQQELGLTDTQLGLMGGIAFAFLYSTLGLPIAWLADRFSRTWIITGALAFWSAATAICGLAQNFVQMFLARMGVGVGEAGGVAPSYSLVADYFPPDQRARAMAAFSFGIPIGSATGIVFGGVIASLIDWRAAFIIVGLAGVVLAPIFRLTVREPYRGGYDKKPGAPAAAAATAAPVQAAKPVAPVKTTPSRNALPLRRMGWFAAGFATFGALISAGVLALNPGLAFFWAAILTVSVALLGASLGMVWEVIRFLLRKPSFWLLTFGASASSMMGYGIFFWLPAFFVRSFGVTLLEASLLFGAIILVGGMVGIAIGGWLADWLGKKKRSMYAIIPAVAFALILPFYIGGVTAPNAYAAIALFIVPVGLGLVWLGPTLSAFQHLARPEMRATAASVFLLINNLLGIGGGVYVLGALSDVFAERFAEESLRYSILAGAGFYVAAGLLFLLASRWLDRDWEG